MKRLAPRVPLAALFRLAKAKAHTSKKGKKGYRRKAKHKQREEA